MKIDSHTAKKIKQRFDDRADIINGIYTTKTKTVIPDDVFESDGVKVTLRTELKLMTMSGGKTPKDYTTTLIVDMNGPRVLIKNPWTISTTTARLAVYDDRKRIVFEIPIKEV